MTNVSPTLSLAFLSLFSDRQNFCFFASNLSPNFLSHPAPLHQTHPLSQDPSTPDGAHCFKNPPSSSSSHELMSTDLLSQPGLHPLLCNGESPSRASIELSAKPALPQDLSAAFCTTYFLIKSCPPPYFCDDKMRLEGPLTDHLVPLCCSKSSLATI